MKVLTLVSHILDKIEDLKYLGLVSDCISQVLVSGIDSKSVGLFN